MIDVIAFVSEMKKISACKSRKGSAPIRVHNLAKKHNFDGRAKLKAKLAGVPDVPAKAAEGILKRYGLLGKGAVLATGIAGWEVGKQGIGDWQTGRAYRKQMQQRG